MPKICTPDYELIILLKNIQFFLNELTVLVYNFIDELKPLFWSHMAKIYNTD